MRYAFFAGLFLLLTSCLALTSHDGPWPCQTPSDCTGDGVSCRAMSTGSFCVGADYCVSDIDCAGGIPGSCVQNACVCIASACSPYTCSPTGAACASSCATNADCVTGYSCQSGECGVPTTPCTTDAACGAYKCTLGTCETSCNDDANCAADNYCNDGKCGPRTCVTGEPGQCNGYACVNDQCLGTCTSNSSCEPGLVCANGVCGCEESLCAPYVCGANGCTTACADDSGCAAGYTCFGDACVGTCQGTPTPCEAQSYCGGSNGCVQGTEVCSGGSVSCAEYDGDSVGCIDTPGCQWDSTSLACLGVSSCAEQPLASCDTVAGCALTTPCTGTPLPCSSFTIGTCAEAPGCSIGP